MKTLADRAVLGEKTRSTFANLDDSIELKTATIEPTSFTLSINVKTPFAFALLADRYLKEGKISSISLKLVPAVRIT